MFIQRPYLKPSVITIIIDVCSYSMSIPPTSLHPAVVKCCKETMKCRMDNDTNEVGACVGEALGATC